MDCANIWHKERAASVFVNGASTGGGSELPPYSAFFWKCEH